MDDDDLAFFELVKDALRETLRIEQQEGIHVHTVIHHHPGTPDTEWEIGIVLPNTKRNQLRDAQSLFDSLFTEESKP